MHELKTITRLIMRFLSYNINRFSQEKLEKVLQHEADVYILPELANQSLVGLPAGYEMEWTGNIDFKGLGVIWKSGMKVEIPQWFNPRHEYFLPIIIDGILIIAAWPTKTEKNNPKSYPQIAFEAICEYAPYFKQYPVIISGDMNCYNGQSGETKQYSIKSIIDFFSIHGLVSIYHQQTGEALGEESTATYYHQFKTNLPFFLDYTFANTPVKGYQLMEWDAEVSDHIAQHFEI